MSGKAEHDRLCLSERCPAGLSATTARPNPPLDGNVQVFRLGLLQNSRDDAVCCSMIGDRRKTKPPDPSACLELSFVTSMLLTKPCFYLRGFKPTPAGLAAHVPQLGWKWGQPGPVRAYQALGAVCQSLARLRALSCFSVSGVCLRSQEVPWKAGKDWQKGQKHRFSFEQIHWDSKRTAVTVSLSFTNSVFKH